MTEREVEKEGLATWNVSKQSTRSKVSLPRTEGENIIETSNQYAILDGSDTNTQQLQIQLKLHSSEQSQHARRQLAAIRIKVHQTQLPTHKIMRCSHRCKTTIGNYRRQCNRSKQQEGL